MRVANCFSELVATGSVGLFCVVDNDRGGDCSSSSRHYPIHPAGPSLYSWASMESSPLTLDAIL